MALIEITCLPVVFYSEFVKILIRCITSTGTATGTVTGIAIGIALNVGCQFCMFQRPVSSKERQNK